MSNPWDHYERDEHMPEALRTFIPKYLWEIMNHPEGHLVTNEEWNEIWNLIRTQGDYNTNILKALIDWVDYMGAYTRFIYVSTEEPDDTHGVDGDLWIQIQN